MRCVNLSLVVFKSNGCQQSSKSFTTTKVWWCYLKIVDFCDHIIQQDHERTLSDDGHSRLYINYGPKHCKLEDVSIPQYVTAAIRILHHLIEGKQIVSYQGIKQYMGYMIKIMELATRFQWVSVLKYDDHFRQLQALHGVPWVFESHHLTSAELLSLPVGISAGSGLTLTRNRKVADNHFQPGRKKDVPPDFASYTNDGHVLCINSNTKGCTLFNCRFAHLCSKKINGVACGQSHPYFKHVQ